MSCQFLPTSIAVDFFFFTLRSFCLLRRKSKIHSLTHKRRTSNLSFVFVFYAVRWWSTRLFLLRILLCRSSSFVFCIARWERLSFTRVGFIYRQKYIEYPHTKYTNSSHEIESRRKWIEVFHCKKRHFYNLIVLKCKLNCTSSATRMNSMLLRFNFFVFVQLDWILNKRNKNKIQRLKFSHMYFFFELFLQCVVVDLTFRNLNLIRILWGEFRTQVGECSGTFWFSSLFTSAAVCLLCKNVIAELRELKTVVIWDERR